jgi:prepilin-type N-terminal cleavage/methylation domain-containing protein
MTSKKNLFNKGFTLIELLIVIAVMAILTTVVFVALNPMARFQDARNSRRWTDINTILSAVKLQQVDNGGNYLQDIYNLTADLYYQVGAGANCSETCNSGASSITLEANCVDVAGLVTGGYMPAVPFDPNASGASLDHTKYFLVKKSNGAISVGSCAAEQGSAAAVPTIIVTR